MQTGVNNIYVRQQSKHSRFRNVHQINANLDRF